MATDTEIDNLLALFGLVRWRDPKLYKDVWAVCRESDHVCLVTYTFLNDIEWYVIEIQRLLEDMQS